MKFVLACGLSVLFGLMGSLWRSEISGPLSPLQVIGLALWLCLSGAIVAAIWLASVGGPWEKVPVERRSLADFEAVISAPTKTPVG
jgi:hypothetical protein